MDQALKILRNDKLAAPARIKKCFNEGRSNSRFFASLIECLFHPDPSIRVLSAEAVDLVSEEVPEMLSEFKNIIIFKLAKIEQIEVRTTVINLLTRVQVSAREQTTLVATLASFLQDKSEVIRNRALHALESLLQSEHHAENDNIKTDVIDALTKASKLANKQISTQSNALLKKIANN